jgi:transglutaminase-like putative cysteine protease
VIWIDFENLGSGSHELTMAVSTTEKLAFINQFSPLTDNPTNSSKDGRIFVTAKTNSDNFYLDIGLNETTSTFDPLNVTTSPIGQTVHPLSQQGQLGFDFLLNNSEPLDTCTFQFNSWSGLKIQDLELSSTDLHFDSMNYSNYDPPYCWLNNLSVCKGRIGFDASTSSMSGTIDLSVTATQKKLKTPVGCYLDGLVVPTNNQTEARYNLGEYEFFLQQDPTYYYTGGNDYCLNFTTPMQFQLRIDAQPREEIDYLTLDTLPSSFSVSEQDLGDEPCYTFTFNLNSASNCCLGLNLKNKGWFIDSENMSLPEIPATIKETYLASSGSPDGDTFDLNDTFVEEWASQVSKNQTNPFIIADSFFQNITKTLSYPQNWQELEKQTFNETVSETLKARSGVCRHYARAYAALCICSGLPARTVKGTAFNFLNETYKKNHEWDEVYLPGCGWVTVDPAWGQEFLLNDEHASITQWPDSYNNLNVTSPNDALQTQLKSKSNNLLSFLIQTGQQWVNKSQGSQQAEILLDQAKLFMVQGEIHEALINIARAYTLSKNNATPEPWPVVLIPLLIVAGVVVLYVSKKKSNGHRSERKSQTSNNFSQRFSCSLSVPRA